MNETPVVTCFLRHEGAVLLVRRSEAVGSYAGRWGAISGHVEGEPEADARREIAEETGMEGAVRLVRAGAPFVVEDPDLDRRWRVHPFLFDADHRNVRLDWEAVEAVWVPPTDILRRETVPALWTSYARVAPSVASIEADRTHGAAYLALRGLEVLRDRAGWLAFRETPPAEAWVNLKRLAHRLQVVRPAMAALANRVNRVMYACRKAVSVDCVERAAQRVLVEAVTADADAAAHAARLLAGRRVLTLSRSGTVEAAIRGARPRPAAVMVAASEPGGEGVALAEALAADGFPVTLVPDAAVATAVAGVDLVVVGADAVLPSGAVVNKTGTRGAALAAREQGIPFYAVAARDKVRLDETFVTEPAAPALREGAASLPVEAPAFDLTPAALVRGLVTEVGVLAPADIHLVAEALQKLAAW